MMIQLMPMMGVDFIRIQGKEKSLGSQLLQYWILNLFAMIAIFLHLCFQNAINDRVVNE